MDVSMAQIVVMVLWVFTYLQTNEVVYLTMCSVTRSNHASTNWCKKRLVAIHCIFPVLKELSVYTVLPLLCERYHRVRAAVCRCCGWSSFTIPQHNTTSYFNLQLQNICVRSHVPCKVIGAYFMPRRTVSSEGAFQVLKDKFYK